MLIAVVRIHYLLRWSNASKHIPEEVKFLISATFTTGTALFVFGFFLWNLDNMFCNALTRQKVFMGWPLAFLLEGHAWWHVFTATGTHMMHVGITYVTLCVKDDYRKYRIAYKLGLVPYIQRVSKVKPT